ncbi:MAG: hypothetical protein AAF587_23670 [Bacteroidota bacterium]
MILGLLLRIIYAFWIQDGWLTEDAGGYFQDAIWLLEGKEVAPFWPPGIPYFLAALMYISGPSPLIAMVGMMGWYLLFCCLFAALTRNWLEVRTNRILLFVFAIYPAFIHHSVAPLSHLPVAVGIIGSVLLILRMKRFVQEKQLMWPVLAMSIFLGIVWAGIILIRPGSLLLIPVFAGGLGWMLRSSWPKALVWVLFPVTICTTLITSWEIYLHQQHNRWVGINDATAMNVFIGNNPSTPLYRTWWLGSHDEQDTPDYLAFYQTRDSIRSLPISQQRQAFMRKAQEHVLARPFLFCLRTLNRVRCFFAFDTYTGARTMARSSVLGILFLLIDACCYITLGILALQGIGGKSIPIPFQRILLVLIVGYAFPYFLAFAHPTYHLAIVPLLAVFSGLGIEQLQTKSIWNGWNKVGIAFFFLVQIEWFIIMI